MQVAGLLPLFASVVKYIRAAAVMSSALVFGRQSA